MSIRPPSDLVLDAVRAADPVRAAGLSARLAAAAGAAPTAAAFDLAMRATSSTRPAQAGPPGAPRSMGAGLEQILLGHLLQQTLPKDAPSIYGAGSAGNVWRGLMADHLAQAMARAGGVGVAAGFDAAMRARSGGA